MHVRMLCFAWDLLWFAFAFTHQCARQERFGSTISFLEMNFCHDARSFSTSPVTDKTDKTSARKIKIYRAFSIEIAGKQG
jgi:hypothetical protein